MAIDREYQREYLEKLAEAYPEKIKCSQPDDEDAERHQSANLAYLEEHGLIEVVWSTSISRAKRPIVVNITATGIDFIADDGGLTAILGVVTVKLHDDTIRQMLLRKVDESDEPETVKDRLKQQIKALPAEGLKEVATSLMQTGISNVPNIISFLGSLLG